MTRRNLPFLTYLLLLSAIAGWLIHKMSWLGRIGIRWMYREYSFMKVWYQAGAAVFGVLLLLFVLQYFATRHMSRGRANLVNGIALLLALGGLYMTYSDFHTDLSHKLLNERFHLGFYLFWIGWISTSLYFLVTRRLQIPPSGEHEVVRPQQGSELR